MELLLEMKENCGRSRSGRGRKSRKGEEQSQLSVGQLVEIV